MAITKTNQSPSKINVISHGSLVMTKEGISQQDFAQSAYYLYGAWNTMVDTSQAIAATLHFVYIMRGLGMPPHLSVMLTVATAGHVAIPCTFVEG